jgi:hypothetical protein
MPSVTTGTVRLPAVNGISETVTAVVAVALSSKYGTETPKVGNTPSRV